MTTPSEATLREMLDLDHEQARELKRSLVAADGAAPKKVDKTLRLADKLMEAHGVEAIRGSGDDNYYGDAVALYVNTGDAYTGTLLYDVAKGRFYATTYGDWVESEERAGRYIPNTGQMRRNGKVIGQLGDVNPLDHSGGIVYESEYGPVMEWTHGLEGEDDVDSTDEGVEDTDLLVYRVTIEDDVLDDLSWVNWKSVASYIDMPVKELREHATSNNIMARASVYEAVASYNGWNSVDNDPITRTYGELDKEWFPGGRLAKTFKPNEASKMVSMDYGTMPTKKAFEAAFEREVDDDEFRIGLSRSDSDAAEGTIIGDGSYDVDDLYKGTKQLVKKFERGDDKAGDLASSILYTLGFEWI